MAEPSLTRHRDELFPPVPVPGPAPARHVAAAVMFAIGVVVVLLRAGGRAALDTIWAEDGSRFLAQALRLPAADSLLEPHVGYLPLYPRLVAELVTQVPLEAAAAALAIGGAAAQVGSAGIVAVASARHLRSGPLRLALAALVVLLPTAVVESMANIAHAQWYLAFAAFWALLWRPARWLPLLAGAAVLFIAPASAPIALILAPLAAARLVVLRGARDRIFPLAYASGAALQVLVVLATGNPAQPGGDLPALGAVFAQRVATAALFGRAAARALWLELGWLVPLACATALVALLVVGLRRQPWSRRLLAALAVALAVASFGLSLYLRDIAPSMRWPLGGYADRNARYTIVPILLVASAVALALAPRRGMREPGRAAGRALFVAVVAVLAVVDFSTTGPRATGPSWRSTVNEGRAECATPGTAETRLRVAPANWGFEVDCRHLRPRP